MNHNQNNHEQTTESQSWALPVFLNFFNNKNEFLHFLSSYFDWVWAFYIGLVQK